MDLKRQQKNVDRETLNISVIVNESNQKSVAKALKYTEVENYPSKTNEMNTNLHHRELNANLIDLSLSRLVDNNIVNVFATFSFLLVSN